MAILLVGFDSAWTPSNVGALVGALKLDNGRFRDLGEPQSAKFPKAEQVIADWQSEHKPTTTIVLLDQPTIVKNATGQRPVENIVGSSVSLRRGGMQPANTSREEMFGKQAPVWPFLARFGGPADPQSPVVGTCVFETYPVLTLITLGWILQDSRTSGRLPKYNPARKKTFSIMDWCHVCELASGTFRERELIVVADWIERIRKADSPCKCDQDRLDACLCLLVAVHMAELRECLMVGDLETGYIVVPDSAKIRAELDERCRKTGRLPTEWVRKFKIDFSAGRTETSCDRPPR